LSASRQRDAALGEQRFRGLDIVSLAFCDLKEQRQAKRIHHQMHLGREPSARAAYGRPARRSDRKNVSIFAHCRSES
jgi:hypothetical protein